LHSFSYYLAFLCVFYYSNFAGSTLSLASTGRLINSTKLGNLKHQQQLLANQLQQYKSPQIHRSYGILVGRILRGALKIRYLLLGGAVGGTVTLNNVSLLLSVVISMSSRFVSTDTICKLSTNEPLIFF